MLPDRLLYAGRSYRAAQAFSDRGSSDLVAMTMLGPVNPPSSAPAVGIKQTIVADTGSNYLNAFIFNASLVAGSIAVLIVGNTGNAAPATGTVTDNLGNTWIKQGFGVADFRAGAIYTCVVAVSGSATITVSADNYYQWSGILREYTGMASVNVAAMAGDGPGTYLTSHSIALTTTVAGATILAGVITSDGTMTITPGPGLGNVTSNPNSSTGGVSSGIADQAVGAPGTYTSTLGTTGFSNGAIGAVALIPSNGSILDTPPDVTGIAGWYPYGVKPNKSMAAIYTMYSAWLASYTSAYCVSTGMPSGVTGYRVKRPDSLDDTVSEGQAYLFVNCAYVSNPAHPCYDSTAKARAEGLWRYIKAVLNPRNLMSFRIQSNGVVANAGDAGAATDADYDILWGLMIMDKQWGSTGAINWKAEYIAYETAILTYEHYPANASPSNLQNVMIDGDTFDPEQDGDPNLVDPDYFAPAYYTAFAKYNGNARWSAIKAKNYDVLADPFLKFGTGLVPDHANRSGAASTVVGLDGYASTYNAVRRFRQALDYLLYGADTDDGYTGYYLLRMLGTWHKNQSAGVVSALRSEWNLTGTTNGGYINATFVAAYLPGMVMNADTSQFAADMMDWLNANPDNNYFGDSIRLMTGLLMTGTFVPNPSFAGSTGGSALNLNLNDSIVTSDARMSAVVKAIADAVTTFDQAARVLGPRFADTVTAGDAMTKMLAKYLTDTAVTSDTLSKRPAKPLSDSVTISDSSSRSPQLRPLDTVTASDQSSKAFRDNEADAVATTDSTVRKPTLGRADAVSTADGLYRAIQKYISDSVTPTDYVGFSGARNLLLTLADTITSTDQASLRNSKSQSDTVSTTDSAQTRLAISRALADSVITSDALRRAVLKTLADSATSSDASARQFTDREADSVVPTDAATKTFRNNEADSITASDATAKTFRDNEADTAITTDQASKALQKLINETVAVTDVTTQQIGRLLIRIDNVTTTDQTARKVVHTQADILTIADLVSKQPNKPLQDSASVADICSKAPGLRRSDAISITEQARRNIAIGRNDQVTPLDVLAKIIARQLYDQAEVSELSSRQFARTFNDTSVVADAVRRYVTKYLGDTVVASETEQQKITRNALQDIRTRYSRDTRMRSDKIRTRSNR